VVDPNDPSAWVSAARRLISDVDLRRPFSGATHDPTPSEPSTLKEYPMHLRGVLFSAYSLYANATSAASPLTA